MRINLLGGPGCGKSVTARRLAADLSVKGYQCELVAEYIKNWAYLKRVPKSFDELYVFSKQLHAEDILHQSGVKYIVTDSPLTIHPFYAKIFGVPIWREMLAIALEYEKVHPSINIFLDRTGLLYQKEGRYESESEASGRDYGMMAYMDEAQVKYQVIQTNDYDRIVATVESRLKYEEGRNAQCAG